MAKILLVEDDNNLREIYGERLMAEGYEIVSASDGEEALQTAVNEKPDLIISDVMMPKISGFDMLDILRQTPETKNVKIIMMTALSQAEDKTRADKLGADKYLVKSQVTLEDVARVVHDLLGDGDSVDAAPEDASAPAPQTIADTQVVDTPVAAAPAPVEMPVATPVVEPATVAAPAPAVAAAPVQAAAEPVAPAVPATDPVAATPPPVVTPPAPDPVVASPVPPAPVPDPSTPVVNPISGATDQPAAPAVASTVQAQDSQAELDEVAQQIQQFAANTSAPEVAHEEPVHEPTEQDIIHAQNAAEEPTIVPAAPAAPVVNPTIPPVTPLNTSNPEPASSRKKVIEPINGDNLSTPDIHALYEQEMAKEAATAPVQNPESGTIVATPAEEGVQNPISTATAEEAAPPPLETVNATDITGVYASDEEAEAAAVLQQAATAQPASATPTADTAALPPAPPTEPPAATDPSDPNNIAL